MCQSLAVDAQAAVLGFQFLVIERACFSCEVVPTHSPVASPSLIIVIDMFMVLIISLTIDRSRTVSGIVFCLVICIVFVVCSVDAVDLITLLPRV